MKPDIETILRAYFFKEVKIILDSGANFEGYLIGIRFPIKEMIMFYMVERKHIGKYLKHKNARWKTLMPYEMIKEIEKLNDEQTETEQELYFSVLSEEGN